VGGKDVGKWSGEKRHSSELIILFWWMGREHRGHAVSDDQGRVLNAIFGAGCKAGRVVMVN